MDTNPACMRLGPFDPEFIQVVGRPEFKHLDWEDMCKILMPFKLTKYCDYNLINMINQTEEKDTLEIRILPGLMDVEKIIKYARFFEALLHYSLKDITKIPTSLKSLICSLDLTQIEQNEWLKGCH